MTELQHMAIYGIWVSPQWAVSEPSSGPLCVSLATKDAMCVLRWTSRSIWGQGNQIYISFPLRGTSIEGADRDCVPALRFTSLLTAWEHTQSHRNGMLLPPVAVTPVSYGLPSISVAMGMFLFKLWRPSVLSRHPGGLAASIHTAFPPRREPRGGCVGDSRRWGWRTSWEDRGWFRALQLGSKSESTWPLPLAAKSCQLPQNDLFVSP